MGRQFIMPGEIITGTGALETAQKRLAALGRKALLVTDQVMIDLGNVAIIERILAVERIPYVIFSGISGEPTDTMIAAGAKLYREEGCDFLIALGGGSPIDAMKAIGVMVAGAGSLAAYQGQDIDLKMPPLVAVPTTAGTGSEATQFTIITDTVNDIKMPLRGRVLVPAMAIIDPRFTLTVPPQITAATGLDALTHAIEAFTSRNAQAMSDTFAVAAVKRIFRYLPIVFKDGSNAKAREEMAVAALEAGIAFNNASVTIVHGMSRPIGALFHVPHGLSNAMLLNECLTFALDGVPERFAVLGREISVAGAGDADEVAAKKFLGAVADICRVLETPTLAEFGVDRVAFAAAIDKMAEDAMASGSPQNTIRRVSSRDIKEIYRKVITV